MARNQEKAQAMLNKYLKGKEDAQKGPKKLRPFLASECIDLQEADKWYWQIIREIGKQVSEIQNPGLGEHRHASSTPWPSHATQHRLCLRTRL